MQKLTIEQVKENGWLIFEAIVGSKAYGLDTESLIRYQGGICITQRFILFAGL